MAEAHAGEVVRFEHPGAGRRRAKSTPKGRSRQPPGHAKRSPPCSGIGRGSAIC